MSSSTSLLFSCVLFFFFIIYCSSTVTAEAKVSVSKAFKYVNQGSLLSGNVEYNADYRLLDISNYPFRLCFYNSTPNAYFLGLGMGNANSTSLMRWVWTANPSRPVTEKAKLIFARDGNLVLVDANGRRAWQTHTADKGVVDMKLLPNGNLVLLNGAGAFVWQSFDYPTDTLLIGQSLIPGQSLVNGDYSMVVEDENVRLLFKSPLSSKKLYYHLLSQAGGPDGNIQIFIFRLAPDTDGPEHADEIRLDTIDFFFEPNVLAQPKYNSTLSILRFGSDGNIRVYTYYEKGVKDAWEQTYALFTSTQAGVGECKLPEKCGSFGLCENSQCIACPTTKGLNGWSKDCKPIIKKLPSCNDTANATNYYKVDGVGDTVDRSNYVEVAGRIKIEECMKKCSDDCKCVAFIYRAEWEQCLLADEISNTLINSNWSNAAIYIKYAK